MFDEFSIFFISLVIAVYLFCNLVFVISYFVIESEKKGCEDEFVLRRYHLLFLILFPFAYILVLSLKYGFEFIKVIYRILSKMFRYIAKILIDFFNQPLIKTK